MIIYDLCGARLPAPPGRAKGVSISRGPYYNPPVVRFASTMRLPINRSRLLATLIPAAVYAGVPALLVWTALRPGEFLYGLDVTGLFYYTRGAIGAALAEGRLPFWEPHVMAGFPMVAGIQAAVFYPLSWLCVFQSPGVFWTTTVILHLGLAGAFAHRWLERGLGLDAASALVGGVLFMLSGYVAAHVNAGHVNYVWAYPWLPALLWRLERFLAGPTLKRDVLLAAVLGMIFLAGVPQFVFFAGLLTVGRLLLFVLAEREGRKGRLLVSARAAGGLALGLLFCAPQLFPSMELLGSAQRASLSSTEFTESYSLPPENLITLLAPTFFGDHRTAPYWGQWNLWDLTGFVGVAGLALAAFGAAGRHPQRFLWAGTAVAALVLALGGHTPVFRLFALIVPGASLFRGPGRYLLLFTLAACALVAMGVQRLRRAEESTRRHALWAAVAAALLLVATLAVRASLNSPERWRTVVEGQGTASRGQTETPAPQGEEFELKSRSLALTGLLGTSVCLGLIAVGFAAHRWGNRADAVAAAFGLLLAIELLVFDERFFKGHPEAEMLLPPEFVTGLRERPDAPVRVATVKSYQTAVIGQCLLSGLDHIGGYEPMMLRSFAELSNASLGRPLETPLVLMHPAKPGPLIDLLGARTWIIPSQEAMTMMAELPSSWTMQGRLGSSFVFENSRALPRAFVVPHSVVIPSGPDRLNFLSTSDLARTVVLESGAAETFPEGPREVRVVSRSPGMYELDAEAAGGFLVLSECFFPGWKVEVDGAPAELLRADHTLQAVRLPPGRHRVRFSYRSTYFALGLLTSVLVGLVPAALLLRQRRKPRA